MKSPSIPSTASSTQPVAPAQMPDMPERSMAPRTAGTPVATSSADASHALSPFEEILFSVPGMERYLDRADLAKISSVSAPLYRNPPAGFATKMHHEFYRDLATLTGKPAMARLTSHILEAIQSDSGTPVTKLSNNRKADILAQIRLPFTNSYAERKDLFDKLHAACEHVAHGKKPVTHQFGALANGIRLFRIDDERQAKYDNLYQRLSSAPKENEEALLQLFKQLSSLKARSRTANWNTYAQRYADAFDAGLHFSTDGKKELLKSVLLSLVDHGLDAASGDQRDRMTTITQKAMAVIGDLPEQDRADIYKDLEFPILWENAGRNGGQGLNGHFVWETLANGLFNCPTLPRQETLPVATRTFLNLDTFAGNNAAASAFRARASEILTRAAGPSGPSRNQAAPREAFLATLSGADDRLPANNFMLGSHSHRFDMTLGLLQPIADGPNRSPAETFGLGALADQLPVRASVADTETTLPLAQVCDRLLTLCDQSSEPFRSILLDALDQSTEHWPNLPPEQIQGEAFRQQVRQRLGDLRPNLNLGEPAPGETKHERIEDIARLASATGSPLAFDLLMQSVGPQADAQSGETPVSLEDKRAILQRVRPEKFSPEQRTALFAAHLALGDDLARAGKASDESGNRPHMWLAQNLNAFKFNQADYSTHYEVLRLKIMATSGPASKEMEALMWNCGNPGGFVRRHEDQLDAIIDDLPALSDAFKARFIPKLYALLLEDARNGIDRSGAQSALLKDSFSIADTPTRRSVTDDVLKPVISGTRHAQGATFAQTRICLDTANELPLAPRKDVLVQTAKILGTVEDEAARYTTAARPGDDRRYEDIYMELFDALRHAAQSCQDRETVSAVLAAILEPYGHTWNQALDTGLPAHVRAEVYDTALEMLGPAGALDTSAAEYQARHNLVRLLPQRLELARDSAQQSDRIRQAVTRMVQESSEPIRTMLQAEMPAQQA